MSDDIEIFKGIVEGHKDAFNELFSRYHRYMVSIAFSYTKDLEKSRDISQEVFFDLWRRRERIRINSSLKSFLRQATINQALTYTKSRKMTSAIDPSHLQITSDNKTEKEIEYNDLSSKIKELIESLPQKCKEVFLLSRYEQKSHKEISEVMNISTKTIENHMTKALKTLRVGLKEADFISLLGPIVLILNSMI